MLATILTHPCKVRSCNSLDFEKRFSSLSIAHAAGENEERKFPLWISRVRAYRLVLIGSLLVIVGCSKPQQPAPAPAAPGAAISSKASETPSVPTGTVKFEFDLPAELPLESAKAIIKIDDRVYSAKDLEQELTLPEGQHSISLDQPSLALVPQQFSVVKNQRQVVHVDEPNHRVFAWALGLGGRVNIRANGKETTVVNSSTEPPKTDFTVFEVILDDSPVSDNDLAKLKNLSGLKSLQLARTAITGAGFVHLRGLPELAELNVSGTKLTDDSLKELGSLPKLVTFQAFKTPIGDAGLAHLINLKLTKLAISTTQTTDRGLESVVQIPTLTSLDVSRTTITDAGAEHLTRLTKLEDLALIATVVTDRGLAQIARLPNLRFLKLDNTQVTDAGLSELKTHPKLTALFVAGTRLTDQGLQQLCESKRWTALRLDNTQVTDVGLQSLSGLNKLGILGLHKTQITDAGLQHLKTLKLLQSLRVTDTKVTDAGIADLKAALPKLKIEL